MTASPPQPRKVEWRRAWRALQTLIDDPERTDQVFVLTRSLAGSSLERHFQRFAAHPEGRRLLAERPSLLETLEDRERLSALPVGSFGRAYAEFMSEEQLAAAGLQGAAESVREPDEEALDPDRRFFFERLRDMHDLWHVLTGYGRDIAGESANLAFTHAQTRNRGIGVIVLAAAWLGPKSWDAHWQRYLLQAWRRGRRAKMLSLARYEELLPRPLEEVRRELGILPAEDTHPGGILAFDAQDGSEGSPASAA